MIEYTIKGILSNWRQWNWSIDNYPLRKEEADVIVNALQELTHCNNCEHWKRELGTNDGYCNFLSRDTNAEGYCIFSEEKS